MKNTKEDIIKRTHRLANDVLGLLKNNTVDSATVRPVRDYGRWSLSEVKPLYKRGEYFLARHTPGAGSSWSELLLYIERELVSQRKKALRLIQESEEFIELAEARKPKKRKPG